jgi:hypothetical protein
MTIEHTHEQFPDDLGIPAFLPLQKYIHLHDGF